MRSVNQNRHLYVVNSVVSGDTAITDSSAKGAIKACVTKGFSPKEKDLYFMYRGRDGVTRSDMIPLDLITYIKHIPASDQVTYLKQVRITLDSTINKGNAVVGSDYILNISFQQFYGLSPENSYVKTVALHVTSQTSSPENFYAAMVDELNASFSREVGATALTNPYLTFIVDEDDPALIIEEKKQPWTLGKWEAESLVFDVFPSTIYVGGEETQWGTAKPVTDTEQLTSVHNNTRMADLEWFTFGERADYYRGMGYPNNFDFVPMVTTDTDVVSGYDALEIHFSYQGSCEDIQKSEKDITLIGSESNISSLISNIEALTGTEITQSESLTPGELKPGDLNPGN